uniref:Uncharacterized protein n=1 Tax=Sphenodon punctatus TaxID=8508 RepID=A0A8D0H7H8_SPHPU
MYLNLVLGNVNVTLLSNQEKVTDEVFNFLLVWYYCTLTIRESILISNGSRYRALAKAYDLLEMRVRESES